MNLNLRSQLQELSKVNQSFGSQLHNFLRYKVTDSLLPALRPFLGFEDFPSVADYNAAAATRRVTSGAGVDVKFVPEAKGALRKGLKRLYQARIFLLGEVSSRPFHWHDFFEYLTWQTYRQSKAALNRRHFFAFDENAPFPWNAPATYRTPEQDALTIFDEGGLIVAYDDDTTWQQQVSEKFRNFDIQKKDLSTHFRFFIFGHAIFEEMIKGHGDIVASAIGVKVDASEIAGDFETLLEKVDFAASKIITNRQNLVATKKFVPVPIDNLLGFPV